MSMFARLFLLIGLVAGVSLSLVALFLWRNSMELERQLTQENNAAGARVLTKGTALLEGSLRSTHQMIVREKARKVEAYFANIAGAVQLESVLIQQFLTDTGSVTDAPTLYEANDLTRMVMANPKLGTTLIKVKPYSIFFMAPGASRQASEKTLNRLRRLGGFFAHTERNVPGCDSPYYGSEEGFIFGYPGGRTFFKSTYDPRKRDWYKQALKEHEPIWIVNLDRDGKSLLLTCANAVRLPRQSKPVGVAAIDVRLPNVLTEMFSVGSLRVSKAILVELTEMFSVGSLRVSKAILVDDTGRVRVSASYDKSKVSFDSRNLTSMPLVSSLSEPGFAEVEARIRATPKVTSGIFWSTKEMADAKSVFIYATVHFSAGGAANMPQAATSKGNWHYIVQLPVDSLLEPVHNVTDEINNATGDISAAIGVRTRRSAAFVLGLIGVTMLVALTAAYFAARSTSRPLIQMASVAHRVGQGDLDQQAVETSGGEIGELGRAINAMISGLKQRNLLKETFGRYVAPSVVDSVLRQGNVELGGIKRVVTIFFSDLEGFTTLAESTPPETLVPLLNEYLDAMTKIILGSEGTLDKYIGDAIMAFWGEPLAHEDDPARACRAALEQFEQLQQLREKWAAEGRPKLNMRIGIETGEVVVGNVGSDLKYNYTVLGDTVNLASRLEGINKKYGTRLLIGETTRQLAGEAIEVREIDMLTVMGKRKPIRVYELLGMAGTVAAEKRVGYRHYEQGLAAYREQRWDEAEDEFRMAIEVLGGDGASEILLERIRGFRVEGPGGEWDGSFVLDAK